MRYIKFILLILISISCKNFNKNSKQKSVARVNDSYLYEIDIKEIAPKGISKDDSTNIVNNYINVWATKQLLIDQAKRNLKEEELNKFDDLVQDYKNTLYINAYKDAVITQSINMEITKQDMEVFYQQNIENFELQEEIVRLRYLHLPTDYGNITATQQRLIRFNDEDKEYLDEIKEEFKAYSFKDSVWISFDHLINKLPILKRRKRYEVLQNKKYLRLRDSSGVYMVRIQEVLRPNETAPLQYIKSTIRQIILNQRKRTLIKNLEKDITKDAITNKQFEIYN